MIEAKETLTGDIRHSQALDGDLNISTQKIYPPIENLTVEPTKEQQVFIHENSYGYDKVTVEPIPEIKLQTKEVIFSGS